MVVSPSVFRVLPVAIHGISQISELVTAYFLPRTIDAAVYMDLRIVIRVYGDFLPWTVGAMDGAATRGRLDICRTLQSTRIEGWSTVAFTGAVLNGHVDCLQWLIDYYPDLYDPEKCLTTAVSEGQIDLVRYLNQQMGNYIKTPYLEIAAADGDVEVIEALRPWADDPGVLVMPLQLALLHNQEEAYNLLIEAFTRDDARRLNNLGLNVAAMSGQTKMVKLLLRKGAVSAENKATHYAAMYGHLDVMKILLAECDLPQFVLSKALRLAVSNDHCAVVESLLNHFAGQKEDEDDAKGGQTVKSCISNVFRVSARRGSINMVKAVLGRFPDDVLMQELRQAGTSGKIEVAKLLLSECERRHLDDSVYIAAVVEKAAQCGDLEMAKLFVHKCLPPTAGAALMSAVANKDVGMLGLFAPINGVYPDRDPYKRRALVRTAEDDQVEMVKILVRHCDQPTIESAVEMIPPTTSATVFNLLLEKLDSHTRKRIFCNLAANGSVNLAGQLLDQIDSLSLRWALMSAASNGHPDMIQVLLSKADTLSVDCALEAAAIVGQLDVVVLLRGRCSSQGWSGAVSTASANGHEEIVRVLKSKCRRISGEE